MKEALEERDDGKISTEFLIRLLELVLKHNIFEFNNQLFHQLIGAPNYSNIFMAKKIDPEIIKMANKHGEGIFPIRLFKRFLDDIIMLWCGSVESLHSFITDINTINPSIQFTLSHNFQPTDMIINNPCTCDKTTSIAFLDTSLSIQEGRVMVDLYRKPTDRNQYLLTSSCHPAHVTKNIPYSLALRIVRICSDTKTRDLWLQELKDLLLSREYKTGIVNAALDEARRIPRQEALKKNQKPNQQKRPVFAVQFDPRLPSITNIVRKHWRSMVAVDPSMNETFLEPPLVASKVAPNLRAKLIRAKVPSKPASRPRRIMPGMKKCGKNNCPTCPYIKPGKTFTATATSYKVDLNAEVDCNSKNICYAILCTKSRCENSTLGKLAES